jgi:hypothetical protein
MKQSIEKTGNGTNRLFARLVAEKKKAILAVCLITLMAFMWIKVFIKKGPEAAEANSLTPQEDSRSKANSQLKISFIKLPKVPGRDDLITRDFFASDGWQTFFRKGNNSVGGQEVGFISRDGNKEVLVNIAGKLNLDAIEMSEKPHAFINGKLLSVGDKLPLRSGVNIYECEVVRIEQDMVLIRCAEVEITLRLKPLEEVID